MNDKKIKKLGYYTAIFLVILIIIKLIFKL